MIDVAKVIVASGDGGNGAATYRREKYVPKGGPDGGDGGDGGDVIITGTTTKSTLRDFSGVPKFAAQSGGPGQKRQKHGRDGEDIELAVPLGTLVWELKPPVAGEVENQTEPRQLLGEILTENDRLVVARGGLGGRGNVHFKSSTNTTPLEYEVGGEGEEKTLELELKLLADVGLVGLPNAGKSTLLSVISKAQPKIADYPFTTIDPNLGVMQHNNQSLIVADIPGLIEKASEGKGLGHQFLRHIERCRVLVYLLAVPVEDLDRPTSEQVQLLYEQWQTLQHELHEYNAQLTTRPFLIAINKQDVMADDFAGVLAADWPVMASEAGDDGRDAGSASNQLPLVLSAATHQGLDAWKQAVTDLIAQAPRLIKASDPADEQTQGVKVFTLPDQSNQRRKPTLVQRGPLKQ